MVWDRRTGRPLHRAIVWQDRRTAARCDELRDAGHLAAGAGDAPASCSTPTSRPPSSSGCSPRAASTAGARPRVRHRRHLAAVEPHRRRRVHATEPSNASRTMLFDIRALALVATSCATCSACPSTCCPRCGRRAAASASPPTACRCRAGMPDQRHRRRPAGGAVRPGLLRAGHDEEHLRHRQLRAHERRRPTCPEPVEGLLTTVAWTLADGEPVAYALEGAIFVTGAAVQWLRDGLGIIDDAAEIGPLAAIVPDTERRAASCPPSPASAARGGTPTPGARSSASPGAPTGAHLARAVVEAMAYQTRDVVDAMTRGVGPPGREPAGRRRRVGDGPAAPAPGRPARRPRAPARSSRRPPRSAPPTSPAWPRACGARSTTSPPTGRSTPSSSPGPRPAARRRRPRPLAPRRRALPRLGRRRAARRPGREPPVAGRVGHRRDELEPEGGPGRSVGGSAADLAGHRGVGQRDAIASARGTGCRRCGPTPPPAAVPGPGRRCRCGRARAPGPPTGSGAQATSAGPVVAVGHPGRASGCRPRRPRSSRPAGPASPSARRSRRRRGRRPRPTPHRRCARRATHSSSMADSGVAAPDQDRRRLEGVEAGVVQGVGRAADVLDVDAVDLVDLVTRGGRPARRRRAGSSTTSSSIARPAPRSRMSMPTTSPPTAPIRLATARGRPDGPAARPGGCRWSSWRHRTDRP